MIELSVGGMTCGGCARAVETAVRREDPAARVSVDLASGKVTVESALPAAALAAAIEGAGYDVAAPSA